MPKLLSLIDEHARLDFRYTLTYQNSSVLIYIKLDTCAICIHVRNLSCFFLFPYSNWQLVKINKGNKMWVQIHISIIWFPFKVIRWMNEHLKNWSLLWTCVHIMCCIASIFCPLYWHRGAWSLVLKIKHKQTQSWWSNNVFLFTQSLAHQHSL